MAAPVTTDQVWDEVGKRMFAVLSYVTPKGHARAAGIVYHVEDRVLYIGTGRESWKARHIRENPNVALCVNIPKRIPFVPWLTIPDATISFAGEARVVPPDTHPAVHTKLLKGLADDPFLHEAHSLIEVRPVGDFVTYGVGVPLLAMRNPEAASGRAPTRPPPVPG